MSRVQFAETVTVPLGQSGALMPVAGIAAIPYVVSNGVEGGQANAYASRTGSTPASTLVTDTAGTVRYWLDEGDYNIHFQDQQSPPRIATFIQGFSSVVAKLSSTWTPLGIASGISYAGAAAGYSAAARLVGTDTVYLRGGLRNTSGSTMGPNAIIGTMPTGMNPSFPVNPSNGQFNITTGGNIIWVPTIANNGYAWFDGQVISIA